MFKQTDLLVPSKEKQQIRPEPQLQIHPKHWFLQSSEGMIQWSKILITSNHYHQLHIRHGEASVPPLKKKNMKQRAPNHRLPWKMMNDDERTPTPSRTQNTQKKRSHQRIMSWSAPCEPLFEGLKDWLQGPWGMPLVSFCQHTSEPIAHIYTSGYETKLQWLHDLQDS